MVGIIWIKNDKKFKREVCRNAWKLGWFKRQSVPLLVIFMTASTDETVLCNLIMHHIFPDKILFSLVIEAILVNSYSTACETQTSIQLTNTKCKWVAADVAIRFIKRRCAKIPWCPTLP